MHFLENVVFFKETFPNAVQLYLIKEAFLKTTVTLAHFRQIFFKALTRVFGQL